MKNILLRKIEPNIHFVGGTLNINPALNKSCSNINPNAGEILSISSCVLFETGLPDKTTEYLLIDSKIPGNGDGS